MTVADRVPASVLETHRGTVERAGRTARPTVALPVVIGDGTDVIVVVIDGRRYHGCVRHGDGTSSIRAVYDSPTDARRGPAKSTAVNRLAEWVEAVDLAVGRTVLLDVVDAGRVYGLRAPGKSAIYTLQERDEGLADIASSIEERPGRERDPGEGP